MTAKQIGRAIEATVRKYSGTGNQQQDLVLDILKDLQENLEYVENIDQALEQD